ncbi:MAG: Ig-like domain-containing protein [Pirellulales bacterium]|nr:Ig-like domain-containing protein [Pirellulales bacterium]
MASPYPVIINRDMNIGFDSSGVIEPAMPKKPLKRSHGVRWFRTRRLNILFTWLVLGWIPILAGCGSGSDLARVTGTVTVNGQPFEGALVQFQPVGAQGSPSAGLTNSKGEYELMFTFKVPGAMIGEHVVFIRTADAYYGNGDCANQLEERIPAKYNARSELRRTVEPGSNTIDFEL